jgi:probable selenium-dependent hydroxylase accessory protein YqeC
VSLVGAGGKTTALSLLARELGAAGSRVVATTTTAMLLRELVAVGPVVMDVDDEGLTVKLREALTHGGTVAAVRGSGGDGKVVGLPPAFVDALWEARLADHLLVEADGSRGLPFKAFGPHEPQVPATSTIVVHVAGLDAIGRPLTAEHVHRAERMAAALGLPLGGEITRRVFVDGLKLQLSALQAGAAGPRIVTLLNGVDSLPIETLGRAVASELMDLDGGASVVVLACLRERRAARVLASAA